MIARRAIPQAPGKMPPAPPVPCVPGKGEAESDMQKYDEVKRLAIIAMCSSDYLLEKLVLKGGNALDIIYQIESRSSVDLDFSMECDFEKDELDHIADEMKKTIIQTFNEAGYEVFDIEFGERPQKRGCDCPDFWGGYRLEFKVIEKERVERYKGDPVLLPKQAISIDGSHRKRVRIEISKFEYCKQKQERDFEGYTIYVYSLEMILFEKLRAICQQMPEYAERIRTSQTARARDFFDIHSICERCSIDFSAEENMSLIRAIFAAKGGPLELLKKVGEYREFHRQNFPSLRDTTGSGIREFDFYFDHVLAICRTISHSLGIV